MYLILYWLFTSYTLGIDLSFDLILIAFCCYTSYIIDCCNVIAIEIGNKDSKCEFYELLKTM